jgi:integrase
LRKGSRVTARKELSSLKSILGEAQRRGLVAQNVARDVRVDLRSAESARSSSSAATSRPREEVQTILAQAQGRWRPLLVTAVFTGMRASELRGLAWSEVDFKRRVIAVRRRADAWGTIGAPKSQAGDREIPMAPMVVNALGEWRLACPPGPAGLVFPNGAGNVEFLANLAKRGSYRLQRQDGLVDEAGKAKYGMHALRHFFASWAIEQGFSPKRVQALLGHSTIATTFDTYGHLFPSLEDDHAKFAAGELALVATKTG